MEDLLGPAIPALYLAMLAVEARWPARSYPPRRRWRWLGLLFLALMIAASVSLPLLVPPAWLQRGALLRLQPLGVLPGIVIGLLVQTFLAYWWHRAEHAFDPLWRLFHQ